MEPEEPSRPAQPPKELDFMKPAIAGGFLLGALSSLPLISLGNALCCLWIQGGGGYAAWLLNKQRPGGLRLGDGALVGVLSGLVGTAVWAAVSIPVQALFFTPEAAAEMRQFMEQLSGSLPPDFAASMAPYLEPGFNLSRLLLGVITFSILGGLFSMIGGILTVGMLNQKRRKV